jgi:hypothetical protein
VGKFIPVEPEKWAEMVKAQAEVARLEHLVNYWKVEAETDNARWLRVLEENDKLKAEVKGLMIFCNCTLIPSKELQAKVERLQSIHSIDSIGIEQLKAEVERLTSDLQMEKENEDRLVREWQKANNEVYGLKTQVAALIDELERLRKGGQS